MTLELQKGLFARAASAAPHRRRTTRAMADQLWQAQHCPRGDRHRAAVSPHPRVHRHHARVLGVAARHSVESALTHQGPSEMHTLVLGQALMGWSAFS